MAAQIHTELRQFAPNRVVEKASYDDFFLNVTAACSSGATGDAPPGVQYVQGSWEACPAPIQAGIQVCPLPCCVMKPFAVALAQAGTRKALHMCCRGVQTCQELALGCTCFGL